MNPWGFVLVAFGIVLIMIGITGSQHKILQIFKGIPAAASGKASATTPSGMPSPASLSQTVNNAITPGQTSPNPTTT